MIPTLPLLRVDGVAHPAWCAYCHNDTFLTEHGVGKVIAFCLLGGRSRFNDCEGAPIHAEVRCLKCDHKSAPFAETAS